VLPDPGGRFASETVAWRFQKWNGRYETVSEVKRLQIYTGYVQQPFPNGKKCPFGCNGHVAAVAVGQSNGFILVSECLPEINATVVTINSTPSKAVKYIKGSKPNPGRWCAAWCVAATNFHSPSILRI
jgi:hypothetical protein